MRRLRTWARHVATGCLLACAPAFAQTFPGTAWERLDPDAAGWSSQKLRAAEQFTRSSLQTDAWMLVHRGRVVHTYGDVSQVSNVASVRKSVFSILIGMQVDTGRFALDRTLADLGIDDKQGLTPTEKQATVRHLLQARSGIYHPSAYESPSMPIGRPARGAFKPGENFNYNNWDFNALGTIFRQVAERTVYEALRDDLAGPLQLQDYDAAAAGQFVTQPMSVHPAYPMRLSTRDMARIGLLMARGGNWNGRQLVSRQWVEESTTSYSSIRPGSGYGYMWWVGVSDSLAAPLRLQGKVFIAAGSLGQFIFVDPQRDIVFVHKVNFEGRPGRDVNAQQFVDLLARVLDAQSR
jgi:CubicO group peptidase (beta-lactamase class C family)